MDNIKVENGYATIIVKPGENLEQRAKETKGKFASKARPSLQAPRVVLSGSDPGMTMVSPKNQ